MAELSISAGDAMNMGFPLDWRITADMAEFYVLERLAHDDKRFAARYEKHVAELAPRLARYNAAICGGELRHMPRQGYDPDYWECYREHPGSCGCHCEECHYDQVHEHDEDCYPDPTCDDESEDSDEECEGWCCLAEEICGMIEGGQCGEYEFWEEDCDHYPEGDGEWRGYCTSEIEDLIESTMEDDCGGSRSGSWYEAVNMFRDHDREGKARLMNGMARAFDPDAWEGGYGGETWQSVAQLTADYLAGKVKAATFIDRCWSLEHNGGNIFNKMFAYDVCNRLMTLLVAQAEGKYNMLVASSRTEVARLWATRNMFLRAEFDDAWLGQQNIWYDEEVA